METNTNRDSEKCLYQTCDKTIKDEELCRNHYLEMIANINANDSKGLYTFCLRGGLDYRKIAIRYGIS